MRIDVHFTGSTTGQQDLHDRVVLVIDVLRASTSIAAALANGARAVIPFEGVDDAIMRARSLDQSDVLLAGERKMAPIRRSIIAATLAASPSCGWMPRRATPRTNRPAQIASSRAKRPLVPAQMMVIDLSARAAARSRARITA